MNIFKSSIVFVAFALVGKAYAFRTTSYVALSSSTRKTIQPAEYNQQKQQDQLPQCTTQRRKTMIMSKPFENEIGATAPLGFFDPLGLVSDGNQDKFNRLRYVELKHGRISMLAVVGYLVQESGTRLPGTIDYSGLEFANVPNGFAALTTIQGVGIAQIIAFIGVLELGVMKDITGGGEFVGDFRNNFIDFGWDVFTPEEQERKRTIELNQGRAAMMGILALMVHEQLGVSILPPF